MERKALGTPRKDKNMIILPAFLDKTDYMKKAKQLLNDITAYLLLDNDPAVKLVKKINKPLKKLQDLQRITKECCKMRAVVLNTIWFCGLSEVHKEGIPLRPIASLSETLTHRSAKEL